jgi:hypothetical protein
LNSVGVLVGEVVGLAGAPVVGLAVVGIGVVGLSVVGLSVVGLSVVGVAVIGALEERGQYGMPGPAPGADAAVQPWQQLTQAGYTDKAIAVDAELPSEGRMLTHKSGSVAL